MLESLTVPRVAIRLMVDLSSEMAQLWGAVKAPPKGHARVIQFAAARGGEGTSTVAREFARYASTRVKRPVWLVDLDLMDSPQNDAIAAQSGRYGPLGRETAASPDGSAFFTVRPPSHGPDGKAVADAHYLVAYPVGGPRLWVTRFRRELLQAGQSAELLTKADYWNALRRHADVIVVDAPAADRSGAALSVARFMDFSVLVVAADQGDATAPAALKTAIIGVGGKVAGLMFNRAAVAPPGFLRKLLP
jgi:Mrp family chromosome partitioning ATPase